jgi:hypothetical protein
VIADSSTKRQTGAGLPRVPLATGPALDPCPPWLVQAGEWWSAACYGASKPLSSLLRVARSNLHCTSQRAFITNPPLPTDRDLCLCPPVQQPSALLLPPAHPPPSLALQASMRQELECPVPA